MRIQEVRHLEYDDESGKVYWETTLMSKEVGEEGANDDYRECDDCIHKLKESPCPCDSCEQNTPTNFAEEEE